MLFLWLDMVKNTPWNTSSPAGHWSAFSNFFWNATKTKKNAISLCRFFSKMKLFFVLYETPGPKKHRNFELLKIGQLERMLERFEVIAKGHQVHF